MTLGELQYFVAAQLANGGRTWTPAEIDNAVLWALDVLASKAAEASGPRMLYEFFLDTEVEKKQYRLPLEVRVVKEVFDVDGLEPYSRIPYSAQNFLDNPAVFAPAAPRDDKAFWQAHRDLFIHPTPVKAIKNGLKIAAYARPPLPRMPEEDVAIPLEAERWVIAKAAAMILPPPSQNVVETLAAQMTLAASDLEMWLWNHHAGVPPGPMEDGVF